MVDAAGLDTEHARLRRDQDLPTRLHEAGAIATFLMLPLPTSAMELALAPVGVMWLWRSVATRRLWTPMGAQPGPAAALALVVWLAVGLVWSASPGLGVGEVGGLRWLLLMVFVQPVLHVRFKLVVALAVGFAVGHVVQVLNAWALFGGGPGWLTFDRAADRVSGWWDPAVSGSILAAALGLHVGIALHGKGTARGVGVVGMLVTLMGLVATGSRGGWLAGAGVLTVGVIVLARRGLSVRGWVGLVLAGVAAAGAAWVTAGPMIASRTRAAVDDLRAAWVDGTSTTDGATTDTGARLAMKRAAIEVWLDHPVAGVGTGGYAAAARAGSAPGAAIHDHAHDTWLHLLASNGVIGAGLFAMVCGTALVQGVRLGRRGGGLEAAPVYALVGLMLATPFDTLHVSGSAAAVFGGLVALCPAWAPPRRGGEPGCG